MVFAGLVNLRTIINLSRFGDCTNTVVFAGWKTIHLKDFQIPRHLGTEVEWMSVVICVRMLNES